MYKRNQNTALKYEKAKLIFYVFLSHSYTGEALFLKEYFFVILINSLSPHVKGNMFKHPCTVYCAHCLRWKLDDFCKIILNQSHYFLKMFGAIRW